jgi:glycopeptide antibiotics resistance protein
MYSFCHFFIWSIAGRFVRTNWQLFFILSIGWELLELLLPFEFAIEGWSNKCMDLVVNTYGYYIGCRMRINANVGKISNTTSQNHPGP